MVRDAAVAGFPRAHERWHRARERGLDAAAELRRLQLGRRAVPAGVFEAGDSAGEPFRGGVLVLGADARRRGRRPRRGDDALRRRAGERAVESRGRPGRGGRARRGANRRARRARAARRAAREPAPLRRARRRVARRPAARGRARARVVEAQAVEPARRLRGRGRVAAARDRGRRALRPAALVLRQLRAHVQVHAPHLPPALPVRGVQPVAPRAERLLPYGGGDAGAAARERARARNRARARARRRRARVSSDRPPP